MPNVVCDPRRSEELDALQKSGCDSTPRCQQTQAEAAHANRVAILVMARGEATTSA